MIVNPDYSFENFVVGPGNRLAHAASVAVAESPGHAYNPFFVHGGVGLGKTHLLQAICLKIVEANPRVNLCYTSCEAFVTQFFEKVQSGEMTDFRNRFRKVDVALTGASKTPAETPKTWLNVELGERSLRFVDSAFESDDAVRQALASQLGPVRFAAEPMSLREISKALIWARKPGSQS